MNTIALYRRGATPLHATRASIGALYGIALASTALIVENPLVLAALFASVLIAGRASGALGAMTRTLRLTAPLTLLLTILVNVLVSRGGLTVFARLGDFGPFGQMNLTVEATIYGLLVGVRLVIVMLTAVLLSSTVNPDELLRGMRRLYPRSALAATVATRLIPVLARDSERMADARRCRPNARTDGMRARLGVLRAVIAGSLDRSLDVAATLEVRGYGSGRRPARQDRALSRQDVYFGLAACATLTAAILTRVPGVARFDIYPLVHLSLDAGVLVSALVMPLLALAPFIDRRGIASRAL